jgi:histidine triad (HIT) family protein
MNEEDSVFTKIIKGEIPCHKIYEDDRCLAFLDIHPQVEGHTLLVPKEQIDKIWDLPDELYHHLWDVAKKLEPRMSEVTGAPRIGIAVEGFGVPHVHIHLIPLYKVEDFKKPQDLNSEPDHVVLAKVAEKLAV